MFKSQPIKSNLHYAPTTGFYIGPYLECVYGKLQLLTEPITIYKCNKCNRQFYPKWFSIDGEPVEKFCSCCGGKIKANIEQSDPKLLPPIKVDDICEKHHIEPLHFGDNFPEEEDEQVAYYLPLMYRTFSIDRNSMATNWAPEDIQQEINEAKQKYSQLINDLNKRFGEDNIILHWGLITCYLEL